MSGDLDALLAELAKVAEQPFAPFLEYDHDGCQWEAMWKRPDGHAYYKWINNHLSLCLDGDTHEVIGIVFSGVPSPEDKPG